MRNLQKRWDALWETYPTADRWTIEDYWSGMVEDAHEVGRENAPDMATLWAAERIDELEQQLAALRENISTYMDEAWHHDTCPRHDGSTFPACNCGFEMAVDALAQEDKK